MLSNELKSFADAKQLMLTLFYLFKKFPKLCRQFKVTASLLNAHVLKLKKVHGTRFVNHQKRGSGGIVTRWS